MDIEKYISNLKGNRNNRKISVVLYDPTWNNHHFIFMINKTQDQCLMMSTSIFPGQNQIELTSPFISQLNAYYSHCMIEETHDLIGIIYTEAKEKLKG